MAFHPYPQVIRAVFNPHRCGPPLGVTPASPCSWVDRPGFGSAPAYFWVCTHALVTGLAFAPAPPATGLATHARSNSPDHNAKGTQSVVDESELSSQPPTACRHVVSGSLSLPALGCFSPVPHGTRPLSVTRESLALEGGPPGFTPDSTSRALLRNSTSTDPSPSHYRALTVSGAPFQGTSADVPTNRPWILQPRLSRRDGLGHYPVRSPLLGASQLISLPPGTEMFQFPGFASALASR